MPRYVRIRPLHALVNPEPEPPEIPADDGDGDGETPDEWLLEEVPSPIIDPDWRDDVRIRPGRSLWPMDDGWYRHD